MSQGPTEMKTADRWPYPSGHGREQGADLNWATGILPLGVRMCVIPISTVVVLQWNGDKFDQDRGRMKRECKERKVLQSNEKKK